MKMMTTTTNNANNQDTYELFEECLKTSFSNFKPKANPNRDTAVHITDDTNNLSSHYSNMCIEPLDVMVSLLTPEEYLGFIKGNIIKYAMRQGVKKGEPASKDAAKCQSYMELLEELC